MVARDRCSLQRPNAGRALQLQPPPDSSVSPNQLFHNLGGGKFEDVSAAAGFAGVRGKGMGISIVDVNGDGFEDVLVVNDTERNFLFMNQGNGTFKEQGFVYGVAFNDDGITVNGMGSDAKDFDNDGFPDFFFNDLATQVFGLFHNEAGRSFRYVSPELRVSWGGCPTGTEVGARALSTTTTMAGRISIPRTGDVDYLGDNASQSDTMFRNENGKTFRDVSPSMGAAFQRKWLSPRALRLRTSTTTAPWTSSLRELNERPRILSQQRHCGGLTG